MTSEDVLRSKTGLTALQHGKKTAVNVEKAYRAFCSQSGVPLSEYDIFKAGFLASQKYEESQRLVKGARK